MATDVGSPTSQGRVPTRAMWVSRALRAAAVILVILAVITGFTKVYFLGQVRTLLMASAICLLGDISLLVESMCRASSSQLR